MVYPWMKNIYMKNKYALAIDIGASSGRHIVGWKENNEIKTEEVYRFYNGVKEENSHLIWDINNLLNENNYKQTQLVLSYDP